MAKMFGLVGETLGHSFSPVIHRMVYEVAGWQAEYGLFQVKKESLKDLIPSLKNLGIEGVNVTIPYKQAILPFLDEIEPEAKKIGAINTISFKNGKTIGANTDYYGIVKTFEEMDFSPSGKRAVILGNGGASKAVQAVLKEKDATIEIFSIEDDGNPGFEKLPTLDKRDILINATPVGMYPNNENSPVEKEILEKFSYAFDLVYNPMPTKFIKEAKSLGLKASTGLSMLVYQAVRSDEIWFGQTVSEKHVKEILEKIFYLVENEGKNL